MELNINFIYQKFICTVLLILKSDELGKRKRKTKFNCLSVFLRSFLPPASPALLRYN